MNFKDFGRPFLAYHYYILGLFNLCLGVAKTFLRNTTILSQNYFPFELGVMKFTTNLQLYIWYIPNLIEIEIGPMVLEKKKLTHDGRQPIAKGHLGVKSLVVLKHIVILRKLTYPMLQRRLTMLHIKNSNVMHLWWAIGQLTMVTIV